MITLGGEGLPFCDLLISLHSALIFEDERLEAEERFEDQE